jgi:hypothetical protein
LSARKEAAAGTGDVESVCAIAAKAAALEQHEETHQLASYASAAETII